MSKGTFAPQNPVDINGVKIPPLILGDSAYPLFPGLLLWMLGQEKGEI